MIYIYCLIDPRDLVVRYVGKTNDPKERMRDHVSLQPRYLLCPTKKQMWVRELNCYGLKPIMQVLTTCTDSESENYEYRYFKLLNYDNNLYNAATIQKETLQMEIFS